MTVSTVVATVQLAQLAFYVNRTINNGLTRARALEVMTQLALYTGVGPLHLRHSLSLKVSSTSGATKYFEASPPRSDSLTIVIGDHRLVTR